LRNTQLFESRVKQYVQSTASIDEHFFETNAVDNRVEDQRETPGVEDPCPHIAAAERYWLLGPCWNYNVSDEVIWILHSHDST
jgi:hypothetical protein